MKLTESIIFLNTYSGIITVTVTSVSIIVGGFWASLKFREYLKDKRFTTYRDLIGQLVDEQERPKQIIKLDRQIAIVYELRNFPSYYPVSNRILNGLKQIWHDERIIKEIDLTIKFMSCPWPVRILRRLRKI